MKVQHNMSALNAFKYRSINQNYLTQTLEKLSSGYKINRAGDDAAGLAISEKIRGQIRGLNMATKNSLDGISLIQVAEGALNETNSMLQRIRALSVQAANDTNTNEDRKHLQQEINELIEAIDSIANNTEFNTKKLLNGTYLTEGNSLTFQIGANSAQHMNVVLDGVATANGLEIAGKMVEVTDDFIEYQSGINIKTTDRITQHDGDIISNIFTFNNNSIIFNEHQTFKFKLGNIDDAASFTGSFKIENVTQTTYAAFINQFKNFITHPNISEPLKELVDEFNQLFENAFGKRNTMHLSFPDNTNPYKITLIENFNLDVNGTYDALTNSYVFTDSDAQYSSFSVQLDKINGTMSEQEKQNILNTIPNKLISPGAKFNFRGGGFVASINPNSPKEKQFLDPYFKFEPGIDVTSQVSANKAITQTDKAIELVSHMRSQLGAYQNRLEHTLNNLNNIAEQLTTAESRIRDADFAKEMMTFTKQKILLQASQSMLSQANQHPQLILKLLA